MEHEIKYGIQIQSTKQFGVYLCNHLSLTKNILVPVQLYLAIHICVYSQCKP